MMTTDRSKDPALEQVLGRVLRAGVLISAAVIFTGGVIHLSRRGNFLADYASFHGVAEQYSSLPGILNAAADLQGRGLIQLGFVLLIFTPILRVVVSFFGFILERDWKYVVITFVVLILLLAGLVV